MILSEIGKENRHSLQYLFDDALESVIKNAVDVRTDAKAKRKIKIDIEFSVGMTDGRNRDIANIAYSVSNQLAPIVGDLGCIDLVNKRRLAIGGIPGQVDYMDYGIDEDGVIQGGD